MISKVGDTSVLASPLPKDDQIVSSLVLPQTPIHSSGPGTGPSQSMIIPGSGNTTNNIVHENRPAEQNKEKEPEEQKTESDHKTKMALTIPERKSTDDLTKQSRTAKSTAANTEKSAPHSNNSSIISNGPEPARSKGFFSCFSCCGNKA